MCDRMGSLWPLPPASYPLSDNDVHVWRADLDVPSWRVAALARTLSPDERARAERLRSLVDRARAIVARGVLRALLARYLHRDPSTLTFQYNAFGKPALPDEPGMGAIRFNVSHADGLALYALARSRAVGVDIERVRAEMAAERIAERFFSPREVATLRGLDPALQGTAFFACWTRKEAYMKARGVGISVGLDRFDVSLAPHDPPAILATREAGETSARWSLHHLAPAPGYIGAVAVAGAGCGCTRWRWQEQGEV